MELNNIRRSTTPVNNSGRSSPNLNAVDQSTGGCQMITLRKYTPAICILEALAIIVFIVYIFLNTPNYSPSPTPASKEKSDINRNFFNATNSSNILVNLVESCNLRSHDLRKATKCRSSSIHESSCGTPQRNIHDSFELYLGPPIMVVTSKNGAKLETRPINGKHVYCAPADTSCRFTTRLVIQPHIEYQNIIGWGGALTDSSVNMILSLTTNGTKRLLDDYFGQDGLKFNMIRVTIGGSDFSSRFYTNDDSRQDDLNLHNFRLREEDILYKIPMLKYIQREYDNLRGRGGLKLFASMWSPPQWMKTNNHFNKGFLKGGSTSPVRDASYFEALAQLKKRFLLAYQYESVQFWGLTVMNEPLWAIQPFIDFNTMIFPEQDYAYYVSRHLGPAIKDDIRLRHIKLMAHDDNRRYLINYTEPILNRPEVLRYIDGVSTHGYTDEEYQLMDYIALKYRQRVPGFFVLPTELCSGHLPFMEKALVGNWNRGVHYAFDIIHTLQHWASGWVDWNMALDTEGGPGWLGGRLDSPIIVDKEKDLYYKSPMFYVLGQFSRYIPPGSVRVDTKLINGQYDYQFETVTFLLPSRQNLTTVILNNNPYPIELHLNIPISALGDGSSDLYQVICEADSVTTLVYPIDLQRTQGS